MSANSSFLEHKGRALVVDAEISIAELISIQLNRDHFAVAGEAASGREGLRLFRKFRPSFVITSLELPAMDGPSMIAEMRAEAPDARILVYCRTQNRHLISAAQQAGANGFVHRNEPLMVFRKAIDAIAQGAGFTSPHASRLLKEVREESEAAKPLNPRERTVLKLVATGLSSKQIAQEISVAPKTADYYRTQIMQKLGMNSIAALTRHAVRLGLVSAECWMLACLFDG